MEGEVGSLFLRDIDGKGRKRENEGRVRREEGEKREQKGRGGACHTNKNRSRASARPNHTHAR